MCVHVCSCVTLQVDDVLQVGAVLYAVLLQLAYHRACLPQRLPTAVFTRSEDESKENESKENESKEVPTARLAGKTLRYCCDKRRHEAIVHPNHDRHGYILLLLQVHTRATVKPPLETENRQGDEGQGQQEWGILSVSSRLRYTRTKLYIHTHALHTYTRTYFAYECLISCGS